MDTNQEPLLALQAQGQPLSSMSLSLDIPKTYRGIYTSINQWYASTPEGMGALRQARGELSNTLSSVESLAWVKKIVSAIYNLEGVVDAPTALGKMSQAVYAIANDRYSALVVEGAAWRLVYSAQLSQTTPLVDVSHNCTYAEYDTLTDRLDALVDTLNASKAACKRILEASIFERFVDNPEAEIEKIKANVAGNQKKSMLNRKGRLELEAELAAREGQGEFENN